MSYFLAFNQSYKFDPNSDPSYETEQAAIDTFNKHVKENNLKVLTNWLKIDGVYVCQIALPGLVFLHPFNIYVLPTGE